MLLRRRRHGPLHPPPALPQPQPMPALTNTGRTHSARYIVTSYGSGLFESYGVGRYVVRVGGACGPPPPVAAPLVPRCALLPAATPREGARSEVRAEQRLAAGGRRLPRPVRRTSPDSYLPTD